MAESRPMATAMTQDVTLDCVDLAGTTRQLGASFAYDAEDPFAITMTFHTRAGDVPWVFHRELLLGGLTNPVGEGDVHIWPSIDINGRAVVVIELNSNSGSFVAHAQTAEVYSFLMATMSVVPLGAEVIDVEAMIDSLLPSI
jgi:hypothetical protein